MFDCVKEWIMEHWEKNYYISAIAGANNGSSLIVMSKGQSKLFECLVFYVFTSILSDLYSFGVQVPVICNSLIKLVIHFLLNGLIKNGRRAFMSLQWPPRGVDGELSCPVVQDLQSRSSLIYRYCILINCRPGW